MIHRHTMEDGRTVAVRRVATRDDRDMWESWIEGELGWGLGRPLNSSLAETLGYAVAHEEWPEWINRWAEEIQSYSDNASTG